MKSELIYESLHFLDRDTLDVCMLASNGLMSMVRDSSSLHVLRHVKTLLLIECENETFYAFNNGSEYAYNYAFSLLLTKLNNCYIGALSAHLCTHEFLSYWADKAASLIFSIGRFEWLRAGDGEECDAGTAFHIFESLRVRSMQISANDPGISSKIAILRSMSDRLTIHELYVEHDVPPTLMSYLREAGNLRCCSIATRNYNGSQFVVEWVDEFIKAFTTNVDTSKIVSSLIIFSEVMEDDSLDALIPRRCATAPRAARPLQMAAVENKFDQTRFSTEKSDVFAFRSTGSRLYVRVLKIFALSNPHDVFAVYHCVIVYLVAFIVGFPLFLFHISVTVCILSRRLNRHPSFQSAFFLVYTHNSIVDLMCFISTLLIYVLHIEQHTSLDITWQNGKIFHCILPFALCFQFTGHVIIALNRYTIFMHPDKHTQIWSGRRLKIAFCVLYVLPSASATFRFFGEVRVAVQNDGPVLVWSPAWIYLAQAVVVACYATVTSLLCAYLTLTTLSAYRRMAYDRRNNDEFVLLVYLMTQLVGQALITTFCVAMVIGYILHSGDVMKFFQVAFSYMMDVVSLSAPVCLFIASDTVRKAYCQMYFRRKKATSGSIIRVQTAQFKGF